MNAELLGQINWLAVIIATVVYFAIGAIWYVPFTPMGRTWATAMGFVSHPGENQQANPAIYALPLVAHLVTVAVTAWLARALQVHTLAGGLVLGLVVWLGYAVPNWLLASVFNPHAKQPMTLFGIYSVHHLLGLLAVGAIVGAWS